MAPTTQDDQEEAKEQKKQQKREQETVGSSACPDLDDSHDRTQPSTSGSNTSSDKNVMKDQHKRRPSIGETAATSGIMKDDMLTDSERPSSIQYHRMDNDGRRQSSRSSSGGTFSSSTMQGNNSSMVESSARDTDEHEYYNSQDGDDRGGNHQHRQQDNEINGNEGGNDVVAPEQTRTTENEYDEDSNSVAVLVDTARSASPPSSPSSMSITATGPLMNHAGLSLEATKEESQVRRGQPVFLKNFANNIAAQVAAAAAAAMLRESADKVNHAPESSSVQMERSRPRCRHYKRNCSIVSPCCAMVFGCRICHDDYHNMSSSPAGSTKEEQEEHQYEKTRPERQQLLANQVSESSESSSSASGGDSNNMDAGSGSGSGSGTSKTKQKSRNKSSSSSSSSMELENKAFPHEIDRFAIQEVICRFCYTRQSSKTNHCMRCNIQFGEYHCSICNLWMSTDDEPYHCDDCGFCRTGGRDKNKHCHDCGMCIDLESFDSHNCQAGMSLSHCPVCQEDLSFDSSSDSTTADHKTLPCGHVVHSHCYEELTSFDNRCPYCHKTAKTRDQMAPTWSAMAVGVALQPVPPEMARSVTIICMDCEERQENRQWHFLGIQCQKCGSFNTIVESTDKSVARMEAAEFSGSEQSAIHLGATRETRTRNQESSSPPPPPPLTHSQQADKGDQVYGNSSGDDEQQLKVNNWATEQRAFTVSSGETREESDGSGMSS